jgi:hypothetical protein
MTYQQPARQQLILRPKTAPIARAIEQPPIQAARQQEFLPVEEKKNEQQAQKDITPKPSFWRRLFWQGKIGPAFWTITSVISLTVNVILVLILFVLGQQLFNLKDLVQNQLIGGLYQNFVLMDQAHIRTTIPVSAEVPAKFDLPLSTHTIVTLTEDTRLNNATIYELNAGALYISRARTNIILPAGTELPVALNLTVPVDQMIPVELTVEVDIPLNQTELHQPFVGLQEVVKPYYTLMDSLPNSWQEALCTPENEELCLQWVR